MFSDIGIKIKSLAQVMTAIGIICYVITGIVFMANDMALVGILIVLIGSLLSWVSSFILYGLGELIDNSVKIAEILEAYNCQTKIKEKSTNLKKEEYSEKNFTEDDFIKEFIKEKDSSPKDFFNEIKDSSTFDLEIILKEQKDLYSAEEIEFIKSELLARQSNI